MSHTECFGSFRDPSGVVYFQDGIPCRRINSIYKNNYELLMRSGLYDDLIKKNLLISHQEKSSAEPEVYKIIRPELIDFISYPYEWSFHQLQDAALLILNIQKRALEHGMSLKDASAYNIQFHRGKAILLDTLSFEKYTKGQPWVAYRQFCQHFLAPLALMSYTDIRLLELLKNHMDGIPLDLASCLLPLSAKVKAFVLTHVVLHAKSQKTFKNTSLKNRGLQLSYDALLNIINDLENGIGKLTPSSKRSPWLGYYRDCNYSDADLAEKKEIVSRFLNGIKPQRVLDAGCNTGLFSVLAAGQNIRTIAVDADPVVIDNLYLACRKNNTSLILPLIADLVNPSPAIGWQNQERRSFLERAQSDVVLALALIHHLSISNNVPFSYIAECFYKLGEYLIIEFVPKTDSNLQRMLSSRVDVFSTYTQADFENEFQKFFMIQETVSIKNSGRILYLMKRKSPAR